MTARIAAVPDWALLALLVLASALLRFWAATRIPTPWITPDEETYALLGRSLYSSGTFEILGQKTHFYSLVTPMLAGAPLELRDLGTGYTLLKAVQAAWAIAVALTRPTLANQVLAVVACIAAAATRLQAIVLVPVVVIAVVL